MWQFIKGVIMATIKDVAKKANVSISTASYALNNHPNVSSETRKKVLAAAKELDYYPNASARNLKTNKTGNVGFFIYGFDGPIFGDILEGVNSELQKVNYNIVVSSGNSSSVILREKQVDAAIIFDSNIDDDLICSYAKRNLVLLLDRKLEGKNIYDFQIDNCTIVKTLIQEAIKKGHQKISYLSGPLDSPSNNERYKGFLSALKEHNYKQHSFYEGDFTLNTGYEIGQKVAKAGNKPDFVFCANDESAIGFVNALNENNIKIPEQIAVAGFDGILLGEYIKPKLTTIQIDYKTWGYDLAKFVVSFLRGKNDLFVKKPAAKIVHKESSL